MWMSVEILVFEEPRRDPGPEPDLVQIMTSPKQDPMQPNTTICCFLLLKCEDLLQFFLTYDTKLSIFGFCAIGQTKQDMNVSTWSPCGCHL